MTDGLVLAHHGVVSAISMLIPIVALPLILLLVVLRDRRRQR